MKHHSTVHKRAILDKYADHLTTTYPDWVVEIVHRRSNGTAGVWGVIQMSKAKRDALLLRIHPWYGVDRVRCSAIGQFRRERQIMDKKQLQFMLGYAPVPRVPLHQLVISPFIGLPGEDDDDARRAAARFATRKVARA